MKSNKSFTLTVFLKGIFFSILIVFLGFLVTYKLPLPAALDLPRQMINGRDFLEGNFDALTKNRYSYTQPDHYFATHHWLYGIFAYLLHAAVGWNGMVIFKIAFILVTFVILFRVALVKSNFWLVAICSIPAIFMLGGRSDLRPELFGYFFIVVYVFILLSTEKDHKSKTIFWLIPIQVLWANLHITFPIGVMLVGGLLLEKIILTIPDGINVTVKDVLVRKLLLVTLILSFVSFLNPLGVKGVIYSLTANIGSNSPVRSSEVQPISSTRDELPKNASIPFALVTPLTIALVISFIIGFKKKNIFYFLASAGSSIMSYYVLRSGPFLGIFFLLAFSANLNDLFLNVTSQISKRWPFRRLNFENTFGLFLCVGILIFLATNIKRFTLDREFGIGLSYDAESSAHFMIKNDIKGPIFNDTDSGSYLTYYLFPRERIYTDNRFGDAYTDDFFKNEYAEPVTNETKWKELLEKRKFNVIFMYQYDQGYNMRDFLYRRINDPEWVFVYADRFNVILVRNVPQNKEVIDKFAITVENAQDRFSNLIYSLDVNDQVTVADIFALMGLPGWAQSHYAIVVSQKPEWAKIWFVMGKMELQRGDQKNANPALALLYLEQAIRRGWKTANSYSFLALAYYRLNQMDKAREAVNEELKINPKSEDAKLWLDTFAKDDARKTLDEEKRK